MMTITPSRVKPPLATRLNVGSPLANGLAGCWLLNEGAGRVAHDTGGQHYDGSFSGASVWVPGIWGPAVDFDGYDDWISMGNCLNLGTDDITVLALVQYSAANQPEQWQGVPLGVIAGKGHLSPGNGYGLSVNQGNKIHWQIKNPSTAFSVASDNVLNDGQWHMAVGVCDRDSTTGVRLYIDGVRQSATADPTSVAGVSIADGTAFAIGSRQDTSLVWAWDYLGRVAAVCVWKRVLAEAEIGRLQREPFLLFARPRTPACFASPAGTFVDVAGSAQGVCSATATLQVVRGLSGVSAAHATARAVLRKAGSRRVLGARPRLRDVLAHGLTPTAFQLGTMLTQGWFWARRRGCTAVYRGPSLTQMDFSHILGVAGPEARDLALRAGPSQAPGSAQCYLVRRFNSHGDPERTAGAAAVVRIGPAGQLSPPAPNGVLDLTGRQIAGRRLQLTWSYCPLDQEAAPQEFYVCWDGGAGSIDLEHPLATIPYQGRRLYQYETGPLEEGRYTFMVDPGSPDHTKAAWLAGTTVDLVTEAAPAAPALLGAAAL